MIVMNNFCSEPEELIQQELEAIERVVRSGWYILGSEVQNFESRWATRCSVRNAVGVGNGMDAIEIGLRTLGIGAGDEVITTPMTAFATILAIIRTGATPVLADIDPETALLEPTSVERCISPRTRAVLLVHLYGQVRNMERWAVLCEQAEIQLLEDCAQAHGAVWHGKTAGSFGVWGAYSFYPTKNLGAMGDGGALVTNTEEIAEKARVLRNYGQTERYVHPELGLNSRLDELQAAILAVRLGWLDAFTEKRRKIAEAYHKGIHNPLVRLMAQPLERDSHVHHLFAIRCRERDRLATHLRDLDVSNLSHYPIPIHHQQSCDGVEIASHGLPHAESHAATCLSIPCHPQMNDIDVARVIAAINEFK